MSSLLRKAERGQRLTAVAFNDMVDGHRAAVPLSSSTVRVVPTSSGFSLHTRRQRRDRQYMPDIIWAGNPLTIPTRTAKYLHLDLTSGALSWSNTAVYGSATVECINPDRWELHFTRAG